jgi:hypothetical protein
MPSGSKSLKNELQIIQRYADLTEPFFKVIKKHFESENPQSQQWAVERPEKAFVKMIPQTIDGEGENGEVIIKLVTYGDSTPPPISTPPVPSTAS